MLKCIFENKALMDVFGQQSLVSHNSSESIAAKDDAAMSTLADWASDTLRAGSESDEGCQRKLARVVRCVVEAFENQMGTNL